MKYFLDSNILRYYQTGHLTVLSNFAKIPRSQLALPLIVVIEQIRGRHDAILKAEPHHLLKEQERLRHAEKILSEFDIVEMTEQAINELVGLRQRVKTRKKYADVIIAAMALAEGRIVVTRNVADFADLLPASRIQNWVDRSY